MHPRPLITCAACAAAAAWTGPAPAAEQERTRFALPAGELRLSKARLQAGSGERVTFSVKLARRSVANGTLELTLPRLWLERSAVSGLAYAKVPRAGTASSSRAGVRRSGRAVRFAFERARRNDSARFTVTDQGLPARTYRLPFRWRESGRATVRGKASVVVFVAPRPPP